MMMMMVKNNNGPRRKSRRPREEMAHDFRRGLKTRNIIIYPVELNVFPLRPPSWKSIVKYSRRVSKKKTTPTSVKICLTRRRSLFVTGKKTTPTTYTDFSQHEGFCIFFFFFTINKLRTTIYLITYNKNVLYYTIFILKLSYNNILISYKLKYSNSLISMILYEKKI